jgi:hypothetical protein
MNSKAIPYKNTWLFPGSTAYELYSAGDFEKLDRHLKEVQQRYYDLMKDNK